MTNSYSSLTTIKSPTGGEVSLPPRTLIPMIREIIARGGACRIKAKGWSMSPFIRENDVLTIQPPRCESYRKGKVVAFVHPGNHRFVVHRIVDRQGQHYRLKGDNAFENDGLIPAGNILGQVIQVERRGRKIRLGLTLGGRLICFLSRHRLLPFLSRPIRRLILAPSRRVSA